MSEPEELTQEGYGGYYGSPTMERLMDEVEQNQTAYDYWADLSRRLNETTNLAVASFVEQVGPVMKETMEALTVLFNEIADACKQATEEIERNNAPKKKKPR